MTEDEFRIAVEGPRTGGSGDNLRYDVSDKANQIMNFGDSGTGLKYGKGANR